MASKNVLGILIMVTIVLLIVSYLMISKEQEGFVNPSYTVRNLEINTCPLYAPEIQTAKGKTDCCQGDMIDGKCNGKTFCTKSPAYDGIPACLDAWRTYFETRGNQVCPATMPNYYEDVTKPNGAKGCSAGPITKDGKQPADGKRPQCKIYGSDTEDRFSDSCYVEKERLKIQCPVVNGRSPQATMVLDPRTKKLQMFQCQYPVQLGMPDKCFDKRFFYIYLDTIDRNWRTRPGGMDDANRQICDNFLARREAARRELLRLEEERRKREAAEAQARKWKSMFDRFRNLFNRGQRDNSRLQQQLDEANRRAQQCKK